MRFRFLLIKNQKITVLIENTGINGEGIAKYNGMTIFIPYALLGEKVIAIVILVKKRFAIAKLAEVLTPAEERARPNCSVFSKCGGCQLQHIRYNYQLKIKTENVKNSLNKIAGLQLEVNPCIKSDFTYNYRNKLQMPIGNKNGLILTGFFSEYSHRIVPIENCPLHPEWADKLIKAVKDFMQACQIMGYNECDKTGIIRHLVARELAGSIMVVLVINADSLKCDYLIELLKKIYPKFSLYLNINKQNTNVVTSNDYIHIYGDKTLQDEYNGIKYEIGPASFMQVNNNIKDKLYYKVIDLIKNEDEPVCIDAYSGAGLLSAQLSKYAKKVFAIEIVEEAIKNAEKLKSDNNLSEKMINTQGDCCKELPILLKKLKKHNTVLVLDPPRKGCSKNIMKAIIDYKPKKIIYISCNPATLSRDLGYITGTLDIKSENANPDSSKYNNLYDITLVQPYDMFPQTKHVETLVCMERK